MLIAKNNFLESLPVQLRLILTRKSEFYSVLYQASNSLNFQLLVWIPIPTPMQDSRLCVTLTLTLFYMF